MTPTPTDQAERLGRAYEYLARARMAFIPVEATKSGRTDGTGEGATSPSLSPVFDYSLHSTGVTL